MLFGNVFATFGATPSLALSLLSALYFIASLCVYVSLIYQISNRIRSASGADAQTPNRFLRTLLSMDPRWCLPSLVDQNPLV